jgi:hypothetical protein
VENSPPTSGHLPPSQTSRTIVRPPRQRQPRKPSIRKIVAQAEKATGKPVTSITMPDGTRLEFGKPEFAAEKNPWPLDEFRTKETKQ